MINMKTTFSLIICALLTISCATQKNTADTIMWVNSSKVPCTGVAPMQCMLVQTGEKIIPENWTLFYDAIEGFTYVPGNIYQLKVQIEDLDPTTVPADASTKRYILKEIVSQRPDTTLNLNDIWMLTNINNESITISDENQRPRLEINLAEKKVFGKGVCNRYSGSILKLEGNILQFTNAFASTRMMCANMQLEDTYLKTLAKTESYLIKDNQLVLYGSEHKEILRFKKID